MAIIATLEFGERNMARSSLVTSVRSALSVGSRTITWSICREFRDRMSSDFVVGVVDSMESDSSFLMAVSKWSPEI